MSDEDRLAHELASLRIDRTPPVSTGSGARVAVWAGLATGLVVMVTGGYYLFHESQGRIFPEEVELGQVTLVSPQQQDVTLVATGYVYARKKATVAPKTTGRLARLFVDEGDTVKDNQVIAELESADAQAQLGQVSADIAAAQAKVERARADVADADAKLAREDALMKRGAGTQANFDDARTRLDTFKAQLRAAEADVKAVGARRAAASVQLENVKVRAPFSGTVLRKLAEIGEVQGPSSATPGILLIATLDDLEVQADVAEAQYSKVRVGTPAEIILDAFPDKRFRGQVSEIRQTVDRSKASVTVKVKFLDDAKGVLPDMAAKVSFLAKALDDAALKAAPKLVAPADAVVTRGPQKFLFTVEDGRVREVPVAVGPPLGTMIELKSGPTTGTRVIRHPTDKIADGSSVKEKK